MKIFNSISLAILLSISGCCYADIAVIVHPSVSFNEIDANDVSRIFLGKSKDFPDGSKAVPINQEAGNAIRAKFNEQVCKKNDAQYKAYWAQIVFTGKGTPPKDVGSSDDIKKLIASNPNMIGYIDSSEVDSSVKVVLKIN